MNAHKISILIDDESSISILVIALRSYIKCREQIGYPVHEL